MFKHIKKQDDKNLLEKGFTLIELLVVVAILGILAAVAIFAVGNLTSKANTNACASEASTVETAADAYLASEGTPAADTAALESVGLLKVAPTSKEGTGDNQFTFAAGVVDRGADCNPA